MINYFLKDGTMKQILLPIFAITLLGCVGCTTPLAETPMDEVEDYVAFCRDLALDGERTPETLRSPIHAHEYKTDCSIVYADADYLSYRVEAFEYTGGAHGMTTVTVGTLDRKTGRKLTAEELFPLVNPAVPQDALLHSIIQDIGGPENLLAPLTLTDNCYLAEDGLHFVYNPLEIACYAAGLIEVTIPYKK